MALGARLFPAVVNWLPFKIRQRIQQKRKQPFQSVVDDRNAESNNLWPLPTTMIKRERFTGPTAKKTREPAWEVKYVSDAPP